MFQESNYERRSNVSIEKYFDIYCPFYALINEFIINGAAAVGRSGDRLIFI